MSRRAFRGAAAEGDRGGHDAVDFGEVALAQGEFEGGVTSSWLAPSVTVRISPSMPVGLSYT